MVCLPCTAVPSDLDSCLNTQLNYQRLNRWAWMRFFWCHLTTVQSSYCAASSKYGFMDKCEAVYGSSLSNQSFHHIVPSRVFKMQSSLSIGFNFFIRTWIILHLLKTVPLLVFIICVCSTEIITADTCRGHSRLKKNKTWYSTRQVESELKITNVKGSVWKLKYTVYVKRIYNNGNCFQRNVSKT